MSLSSQILYDHKLRQTEGRIAILDLMRTHKTAISQPEIERTLGDRCDRVTIYRTLSAFLEKGILHKVLDDAGAMKYALCAHDCHKQADAHHHDHVHFKCEVCNNTTCINDVHIPTIHIPQGFRLREVNVLMQGTCANCTHQQP